MQLDFKKQFVEPFRTAVAEDPKKAGVLGILALVLVILVGRLVLRGGTTPSPADAKLTGSSSSFQDAAMRNSARSDKRSVSQLSLREWLGMSEDGGLSRNLFAVNASNYRRDSHSSLPGQGEAKLLTVRTDQSSGVMVGALDAQAAALRLESTILGAKPLAMISGQLVSEGQVFQADESESAPSFLVKKIETRRVILESGGVGFEITMK